MIEKFWSAGVTPGAFDLWPETEALLERERMRPGQSRSPKRQLIFLLFFFPEGSNGSQSS